MPTRTIEHYRNGVKVGESTLEIDPAVAQFDDAAIAVRGVRPLLAQWAQDATADADAYGTMSAAQRLVAQERVLRRFGRLCQAMRATLLLTSLDES